MLKTFTTINQKGQSGVDIKCMIPVIMHLRLLVDVHRHAPCISVCVMCVQSRVCIQYDIQCTIYTHNTREYLINTVCKVYNYRVWLLITNTSSVLRNSLTSCCNPLILSVNSIQRIHDLLHKSNSNCVFLSGIYTF